MQHRDGHRQEHGHHRGGVSCYAALAAAAPLVLNSTALVAATLLL
jgi:hypothetical protein